MALTIMVLAVLAYVEATVQHLARDTSAKSRPCNRADGRRCTA
ncbi:hypothetical protein [Photobacterium arenosum]|nr:hypothetical protein [Photobacterium arenosum]